jgi:hypothetical protein
MGEGIDYHHTGMLSCPFQATDTRRNHGRMLLLGDFCCRVQGLIDRQQCQQLALRFQTGQRVLSSKLVA